MPTMAESCYYAVLKELMINKTIVGTRDTSLSVQLQLDPELTLTKALTKVKMREAIKIQHE